MVYDPFSQIDSTGTDSEIYDTGYDCPVIDGTIDKFFGYLVITAAFGILIETFFGRRL